MLPGLRLAILAVRTVGRVVSLFTHSQTSKIATVQWELISILSHRREVTLSPILTRRVFLLEVDLVTNYILNKTCVPSLSSISSEIQGVKSIGHKKVRFFHNLQVLILARITPIRLNGTALFLVPTGPKPICWFCSL